MSQNYIFPPPPLSVRCNLLMFLSGQCSMVNIEWVLILDPCCSVHFSIFCCFAALKPDQRIDGLTEGQLNQFIVITLYQQQPNGSKQTTTSLI